MLQLLEKTRDLKPVVLDSHKIIRTFEQRLFVDESTVALRSFYVSDDIAGQFFLARDGDFPNMVFESVASVINRDSMHCLYFENPVLKDRLALRNIRRDLIHSIEQFEGCPHPNMMVVEDPGRGRSCYLRELCTMQLVDILRTQAQAHRLSA